MKILFREKVEKKTLDGIRKFRKVQLAQRN